MSKTKMCIGIMLLIILLAISGVLIWQLYGKQEGKEQSGTLVGICPKTECAYIPLSKEYGDNMI